MRPLLLHRPRRSLHAPFHTLQKPVSLHIADGKAPDESISSRGGVYDVHFLGRDVLRLDISVLAVIRNHHSLGPERDNDRLLHAPVDQEGRCDAGCVGDGSDEGGSAIAVTVADTCLSFIWNEEIDVAEVDVVRREGGGGDGGGGVQQDESAARGCRKRTDSMGYGIKRDFVLKDDQRGGAVVVVVVVVAGDMRRPERKVGTGRYQNPVLTRVFNLPSHTHSMSPLFLPIKKKIKIKKHHETWYKDIVLT